MIQLSANDIAATSCFLGFSGKAKGDDPQPQPQPHPQPRPLLPNLRVFLAKWHGDGRACVVKCVRWRDIEAMGLSGPPWGGDNAHDGRKEKVTSQNLSERPQEIHDTHHQPSRSNRIRATDSGAKPSTASSSKKEEMTGPDHHEHIQEIDDYENEHFRSNKPAAIDPDFRSSTASSDKSDSAMGAFFDPAQKSTFSGPTFATELKDASTQTPPDAMDAGAAEAAGGVPILAASGMSNSKRKEDGFYCSNRARRFWFWFMSLPLELRELVYAQLFAYVPTRLILHASDDYDPCWLISPSKDPSWRPLPPTCLVNKQLFDEGVPVLLRGRHIKVKDYTRPPPEAFYLPRMPRFIAEFLDRIPGRKSYDAITHLHIENCYVMRKYSVRHKPGPAHLLSLCKGL